MIQDIDNPNKYHLLNYNVCIVKGCLKPAEWMQDGCDYVGLCDDCFEELCDKFDEHKSKGDKTTFKFFD